jgi:hypothetical protein
MKLKMLALMVSVLISGCAYNLDDVEKSKKACAEIGGEFSTGINGLHEVMKTYCTVDNIRYTFSRDQGNFFDGRVVK